MDTKHGQNTLDALARLSSKIDVAVSLIQRGHSR